MKHSERFTNAVTKLYNAFHKGELNAWDCQKCCVGSMCDGNPSWSYLRIDGFNTGAANYITTSPYFEEALECAENTGYTGIQIVEIENIFLDSFEGLTKFKDKDYQFKGLCAVIEYLCELEGIPNIMDYKMLFEYDKESPKHQLSEVFV